MVAIVLAAGKGTRMKSDLPKVLCTALGRPLVEYVLDALRESGAKRMIVVVGYRAEDVKFALAGRGDVEFVVQEKQLGTGHAVMECRDRLADYDGPVIVVAGDSPMLQSSSLRILIDEFRTSRPACLLGTLIHDDPTGLGRIVRDRSGRFTGIVEQKDATDEQRRIREVNMSTYVFDCRPMLQALERLTDHNQQSEYYLTDLPSIMLAQGLDVRALPVLLPIEALSVNTVEHLAQVEQAILRQSEGAVGS
jgi:bifunctional UDP-N-acetylglucosamine pyrophosphorylase/glucosamine-1-phosphate N-acetyltransferase/UDP-N-acetylglucosamine pyrophosphorylase